MQGEQSPNLTFLASFLIDFLGNLAKKIANAEHMIAGHLVINAKRLPIPEMWSCDRRIMMAKNAL